MPGLSYRDAVRGGGATNQHSAFQVGVLDRLQVLEARLAGLFGSSAGTSRV